jgi:hypothetical protein
VTTVQEGTLKLANGAAISASPSIRVDSGATFDLSDLVTEYVIERNVDLVQRLQGGGIVIAPAAGLVINGELAPGGVTPATLTQALTIQGGPLSFGFDAVLTMELGGLLTGEFDQLLVSDGLLTLGGTLVLTLVNGLVPASVDSYTIISGAMGVGGEFGNVAFGDRISLAEGSYLLSLSGNDVLLSDFIAIPEPSTFVLLLLGLVAFYAVVVRGRRVANPAANEAK